METTFPIGAWSLLAFRIDFSDGRPASYPFVEDAQGLIIYSHDGMMSALLSKSKRAKLSNSRLEDALKASTEEKVRAFDSYLQYAGTYRLEGEEIVHRIQFAMDPTIIGTEQRRRFSYQATTKKLQLTYEVAAKSGVTRHFELLWHKIGD